MKYILTTLILFFSLTTAAHAANVSFLVGETLSSGLIPVDIVLAAGSEHINAVEMDVVFPNEFLRFSGYSSDATAVRFWVAQPSVQKEGVVHLSGIIPGGVEYTYDPQNGIAKEVSLVRLLFAPLAEGGGMLTAEKVLVLRNDGAGSPISVTVLPHTIEVGRSSATLDTTPPEPFTIQIIEKTAFGKTPRLAVFTTTDDRGVAYYEAQLGFGAFKRVESPYPLHRGLFPATLTVRAVDYAGNTQEARVTVPGIIALHSTLLPLYILFILFVILLLYKRQKTGRL